MRILAADIEKHEGEGVELLGWVDSRRDHGKLIFIDIRDRSGIAQAVFLPASRELQVQGDRLRPEWVIRIKGTVGKRPEGMENQSIPSGSHEIAVSELEVLTEAKTLPLDVSTDGKDISEEVRMKYRYLDLRRPRMQKNIRMRAKINRFIRDYFSEKHFSEIETPYISKSTPEGARDYLVPSRVYPGKFYALPQSPQQYKQLLMVAGFEQYFQIVRCFRDEDTRGDRQPEFTQLDIEKSFTSQEEIMNLVEGFLISLVKTLYPEKRIQKTPFPRIPYQEAMDKYGTDRPDIRENKEDPNELAFAFIVDFPAFEWKERESRWDAVHHPFTQPDVKNVEDFDAQFEKDPGAMRARQYDVVLNGFEIAGGSIRVHNPELLARIFEVMGNNPEDVQKKFGHLLEAFQYGVPPHGGIAFGLDRLVAILQNEPNIREIIAFSKTGDGRDLMMDSPSEVSEEQLKELHIALDVEEQQE